MSVRLVTLSDLTAIAQLEIELFGEHAYPYFVLRQYYDLHASHFWVVEQEGRLCGYLLAGYDHFAKIMWILALAVSQDAQGRGYGQALIQSALNVKPHQYRAHLTVDPNNERAIALYQRMGFQLAELDNEYFGINEPRWVMSLNALESCSHSELQP
ncbi:GNAT family N-acetyltransferase [Vibrio sp. SM6]|uniref:GNAT family N-acetyltransferase n=1 Tax=Vibrio agarilyticus TaxID=2726741 RepID=A0A7X8TNT2_9VIBR|nr:GNAT family N-acetyltransferase [Vibrio agarilyticus]NLS12156.1 GNAT family N-acetyltransferase [Vibrio agarilyticus]